ncbi:MAG TPA: glycerate kinase [Bacillota bacterium]|nr:glycerate kinase [Bacillota bacterium]
MKIVLAPDSFKGSLSAHQVCTAMAAGIQRVYPNSEIIQIPMADGGEGTLQAIIESTEGRLLHRTVTGPLGDKVAAEFGILPDQQTAIIEMASASGLTLIPEPMRNPCIASSIGTGQLILAALDEGCRRLVLGIGGSATNDGGVGIAEALGYRFLDADGRPLPPGGLALLNLARIDADHINPRLKDLEVKVICDVTNPLTGPEGASLVYGPQKGADPATARLLDQALGQLAKRIQTDLGLNLLDLPGGGAAGGTGAGLVAFLGAQLKSGVELVADLVGLANKIRDADLVITGEGRIDRQTRYGKVPFGVTRIAKELHIPVFAIAGQIGHGAHELHTCGMDGILSISDGTMTMEDAMKNADILVETAAEELVRIFFTGRNSGVANLSTITG